MSQLAFFVLLQLFSIAKSQCVGNSCFDDTRRSVGVIAGVTLAILGGLGLLTIFTCIYVIRKRRRIRQFQTNFVQNAQANANANPLNYQDPNQPVAYYPPPMQPQPSYTPGHYDAGHNPGFTGVSGGVAGFGAPNQRL